MNTRLLIMLSDAPHGGLEFALPVKDAQRLAAAETLDGRAYAGLSEAGRDVAMDLHAQGHYQLLIDEEG